MSTTIQRFRKSYRDNYMTGSCVVSDKEKAEIVDLTAQGYEPKAISEILGVSPLTIRYHLHPHVRQQMKVHSEGRARDRHRRSGLTTTVNGKQVVLHGLHKRPYPADGCEVCGSDMHLLYHHWDPKNPSKGIWTCHKCHNIVEVIDKEGSPSIQLIREKYLSIKNRLDGGN